MSYKTRIRPVLFMDIQYALDGESVDRVSMSRFHGRVFKILQWQGHANRLIMLTLSR